VTKHRKTHDNYCAVCWSHGHYRIAECSLGLQWLFQRRRPRKSAAGAAGDTLDYCLTRRGLIRLHRAEISPCQGFLDHFPNRFRPTGR
jgi:hypothetical protein